MADEDPDGVGTVVKYAVYILRSRRNGRYYVGQRRDSVERLGQHNAGKVKSTRLNGSWELVWTELHDTRAGAVKREREIKGWKSRAMIERLVERSRLQPRENGEAGLESGRKSP